MQKTHNREGRIIRLERVGCPGNSGTSKAGPAPQSAPRVARWLETPKGTVGSTRYLERQQQGTPSESYSAAHGAYGRLAFLVLAWFGMRHGGRSCCDTHNGHVARD